MNFGSVSFYPVYLTIGNITKAERRKDDSYMLLGYLPELQGTDAEKKEWGKSGLKLRLLHECLREILKAIVSKGTSGALISDPTGTERLVFPLFAYYAADWPEGKKITMTRDTKMTAEPCHACHIPKARLGEISPDIRKMEMKSVTKMRAIFDQAMELINTPKKKGEGRALLARYSLQEYAVSNS